MKKALIALLCALPSVAAAQTASFVVTAGKDTISVEQFTRDARSLQADLHTRGLGPRLKYTLELDKDGNATTFHNTAFRMDNDTVVAQTALFRFVGDSAIVDITTNGSTVTQRIKTELGAIPFINLAFSLVEPMLAVSRTRNSSPAKVSLFTVAGGMTMPAMVTWIRPDSASVVVGGIDLQLSVDAENRILGGFIPSQNVRITRVSGAVAAPTVKKADYSAPANAAYTAENVTITTPEGHTLAGTLTLPKQRSGRVPVVVTISGSGLQNRDEAIPSVQGFAPFRQIAEALAARGIGVLRYDDRGFAESTGNPGVATSEDFANDVRSVLAYLRARSEVATDKLFLLGHSEGGMIAPMVAAVDPQLRGIVLLAGTSRTGRRIMEYQNRYSIDSSPQLTAAQRDSLYKLVGPRLDTLGATAPWVRFFMSHDPVVTAKRVRTPVLILQGANDRQVTADQAPELAAAFRAGGNRDVTMHVVPGVNHLFLIDPDGNPAGYPALPEKRIGNDIVTLIGDWLVKHSK